MATAAPQALVADVERLLAELEALPDPFARQTAAAAVQGLVELYGAGLPVGRAMDWAADACGNPRVADMIHRQVPRIERGDSLTDSLAATGFFWFWFVEALHFDDAYGGMLERYNTPFKIFCPVWPMLAAATAS